MSDPCPPVSEALIDYLWEIFERSDYTEETNLRTVDVQTGQIKVIRHLEHQLKIQKRAN